MNRLLSSINEHSSSDFRELLTYYLGLINGNEVKILEILASLMSIEFFTLPFPWIQNFA